jgi:hypothetical protein
LDTVVTRTGSWIPNPRGFKTPRAAIWGDEGGCGVATRGISGVGTFEFIMNCDRIEIQEISGMTIDDGFERCEMANPESLLVARRVRCEVEIFSPKRPISMTADVCKPLAGLTYFISTTIESKSKPR